jgi:hypothetical protein
MATSWWMRFLQRHLQWTDIEENGVLYMRRFYLVHPRRGLIRSRFPIHVFIHYIARSDYARDLHDHPWDWMAIRLTGGYMEVVPGPGYAPECGRMGVVRVYQYPFTGHLRRAEDLHRLELKRPVWTLFLHGRRRREWGFRTDQGWVREDDYHARRLYGAKEENPPIYPPQ